MKQNREDGWLKDLAQRQKAILLVRDRLGCTCPAEIFDHYQVRRIVMGDTPLVQMIMGNRLLLWIVDSARILNPDNAVPVLLKEGMATRDDLGLNRFRLVLVGDYPSYEREWGPLAKELGPRVHLHVLASV